MAVSILKLDDDGVGSVKTVLSQAASGFASSQFGTTCDAGSNYLSSLAGSVASWVQQVNVKASSAVGVLVSGWKTVDESFTQVDESLALSSGPGGEV